MLGRQQLIRRVVSLRQTADRAEGMDGVTSLVAPLEGSVDMLGFGFGLLALVIVPLFLIATAFFWRLWNDTIPEVFGLKRITYWQALRLFVIAALVLNLGIG